MKRDFELLFLIFNVLIDNEENHVTPRDVLGEKLNSYNHSCVEYHLQLMSEQGWIKMFTDGIRMTWEGHDYFDKEFVSADGGNNEEPVVNLTKV